MPEHTVSIKSLPELEVANTDVVFQIKSDARILGYLTVSRGGIGWHIRGPSDERHLTWEQFDDFIKEHRP